VSTGREETLSIRRREILHSHFSMGNKVSKSQWSQLSDAAKNDKLLSKYTPFANEFHALMIGTHPCRFATSPRFCDNPYEMQGSPSAACCMKGDLASNTRHAHSNVPSYVLG
jgi:hypothetical protein